jgi:two-component system, chemotaxis family, protein-glutamate methylesterase/glutaminase
VETVPDPAGPALAPVADGVVVAGASAGGVEALIAFVRSLPSDTDDAICIVLHVSPSGTSAMPHILARAGSLPVHSAGDGDPLLAGHVYVAPPDHHLLVEPGLVRLSQQPRQNGHRPSIDATMSTAAEAYGGAAVGIVLSGSRDDGTAGLVRIKQRGGAAVVQDPGEALYDAMPRSALVHVDVDAVLPVGDMAAWIAGPRDPRPVPPDRPPVPEPDHSGVGRPPAPAAKGTRFSCPDCGGVLFEEDAQGLERFRCSVGHAFSIESLSHAQGERLENAIWAAVRALEDRAVLLDRLADGSRHRQRHRSSDRFRREAADARERARTIRTAIAPERAVLAEEAGAST